MDGFVTISIPEAKRLALKAIEVIQKTRDTQISKAISDRMLQKKPKTFFQWLTRSNPECYTFDEASVIIGNVVGCWGVQRYWIMEQERKLKKSCENLHQACFVANEDTDVLVSIELAAALRQKDVKQ